MTDRTPQPSSPTAREPWMMQGWEPRLDEMLADPVVQAMMKVDGVRPGDVVRLLQAAQARMHAAASSR